MDIAELDINAVCFGILCNFPQYGGNKALQNMGQHEAKMHEPKFSKL